ncbi:MAG: T9SS type A sorting domain-containing protein [Actinomycetota bacterium]|nr:T9SS type A sorting domain-containing protein [Actinomycetota bacterium]
MRHKKVKLIALLLLGIGFTGLRAQTAISAIGGNATGSGGTVSYTVGQIAYTGISGPSGSVTQGVQQPYEFFTVGTDDTPHISLYLNVFPNPTATGIFLRVSQENPKTYTYHLYDFGGKLLQSHRISSTVTPISLEHLEPATYLLSVVNNQTVIKTFKIIKNK